MTQTPGRKHVAPEAPSKQRSSPRWRGERNSDDADVPGRGERVDGHRLRRTPGGSPALPAAGRGSASPRRPRRARPLRAREPPRGSRLAPANHALRPLLGAAQKPLICRRGVRRAFCFFLLDTLLFLHAASPTASFSSSLSLFLRITAGILLLLLACKHVCSLLPFSFLLC